MKEKKGWVKQIERTKGQENRRKKEKQKLEEKETENE